MQVVYQIHFATRTFYRFPLYLIFWSITSTEGLTGSDEMCNVYMMYYTNNADNGTEFQSCGYLCNAEQNRAYPADSIQPLPPNPLLEAYAIHGKMNHQLRNNSTIKMTETTSEEKPIIGEQTIHHQSKEEKGQHHSHPQEDSNAVSLMDGDAEDLQQLHLHLKIELKTTTEIDVTSIPTKGAPTEEVHREKVNTISSKLDSQKREDNFWSFLFFYRRFFSS